MDLVGTIVLEDAPGNFLERSVLFSYSRLCVESPTIGGFVFKCRDDSPRGIVAMLFFFLALFAK